MCETGLMHLVGNGTCDFSFNTNALIGAALSKIELTALERRSRHLYLESSVFDGILARNALAPDAFVAILSRCDLKFSF